MKLIVWKHVLFDAVRLWTVENTCLLDFYTQKSLDVYPQQWYHCRIGTMYF